MGRRPCCSKVGLNIGMWTSAEDKILTDYIQLHGEGQWRNLPKRAGLKRCGKSCRLRWLNYLRPDIKRGNISDDEEDLIIRLHKLLGNRWSLIAGRLPGRTDNEIKNYWNTTLRKKARDNHTTSAFSTPKTSTKQQNFKKSDKIKRQTTTPDDVDSSLAQTPSEKCTELINISLKPDDRITNVLEPNMPEPNMASTLHPKVGSHQDKMYTDLIPRNIFKDGASASTNEGVIEPKDDNQPTINLEPYTDSSNICLTGLLTSEFSGLFGSNIYGHAENENNSTSPSSDERSIMEMLEELWSAENMIIESNLGSPTDLHFASTSDCIGDWLL